jgi:hypothetical protein
MTLRVRNDPFSQPENGDGEDEQGGSLIVFARILAFLFAAVLTWILYRVITGAWSRYQETGAKSLFDRRRGTYRRIPSLRLHRPEEDDGYRDADEELDVDAAIEERGKGKPVNEEVVDEGFHDGESSLGMDRAAAESPSSSSANVWKELPQRPLPDKPLPEVPRA